MFGKDKRSKAEPPAPPARPSRRHGRRPIRSSITGAHLPNPDARVARFELAARAALELLRQELGEELRGVRIGFATAPMGAGSSGGATSDQPMFYSIDRAERTIVLYRMPIQRAKGLHVDDEEHRRFFIGHCVHRAVSEYLGRPPWDIAPGRFEHF